MEKVGNRIHLVLVRSECTGDMLCVRAFRQCERAEAFTRLAESSNPVGTPVPVGLKLRIVAIPVE